MLIRKTIPKRDQCELKSDKKKYNNNRRCDDKMRATTETEMTHQAVAPSKTLIRLKRKDIDILDRIPIRLHQRRAALSLGRVDTISTLKTFPASRERWFQPRKRSSSPPPEGAQRERKSFRSRGLSRASSGTSPEAK